jgi:membrane-associated HD superfamily phosphohydrolase
MNPIINYFTPPKIFSKKEMINYLVWLAERSIVLTYPFNILSVVKSLDEKNYHLFYFQFFYLLLVALLYFLFIKYKEKHYTSLTFSYILIGLISTNIIVFLSPAPGFWNVDQ